MLILGLLFVFAASMVTAALHDLATMEIPNWLVGALAACFFPFAAISGLGWGASLAHVACAFLVLLVVFGFFAAGWMGGGDSKFIAAIALWLGPSTELSLFLVWASLFGGVLTMTLLVARACLSPTTGVRAVDRLLDRSTGIPYGVALGAAGLMVIPAL